MTINLFKSTRGPKRVRTTDGKYARKVKIGGMYTGYFYMPARSLKK